MINNCSSCTDKLCSTCASGYKLMKGHCYDRCPWYTTETQGNCVDLYYNAIARPHSLLEDMINTDFSHSDL